MIDVRNEGIIYCRIEDMVTQDIQTTNRELYTKYNWFATYYPPVVQRACDNFFLPGFQFIFLGLSKNMNTLMDRDSYFVTKVRINEMYEMFFRASEKTIGLLLERTLGRPDSKFNLNKLTDLEAKIITAFNDYMYSAILRLLSPAPPTLKRTNFDVIHLTFLVKDIEKNEAAKFIITLPEVMLNPDVVTNSGEKFDNNYFLPCSIKTSIKIGSLRLRVFDLKNIDVGDIVVLDNSNINHMTLELLDFEKDININPRMDLVIPFDNDEGEEEDMSDTNLWDSIEVEMDAKFKPVKITLGELKSIEEGLVVDLSSIYDNQVTLCVEDKMIARGELVIVNDRYGVKVKEIAAEEEIPEQAVANTVNNVQTEEQVSQDVPVEEQPIGEEGQPEAASEEDEFDYSDFELEDEDI